MTATWVRVLRGLAHRGAATALLALLAIVAAGAAAAAPAYVAAAKAAIVESTLDQSPASAGQLEVTYTDKGDVTVEDLDATVRTVLSGAVGPARVDRVLAPSVLSYESSGTFGGVGVPVVFRSNACASLHLESGRCPERAGEALESSVDAQAGITAASLAAGGLTVVGIYTRPIADPAFFNRSDAYFPDGETADAVFVPEQTAVRFGLGGKDVVDIGLRTDRLSPADVEAASRAYLATQGDPDLDRAGENVSQTLDGVVTQMHAGFHTLAVPTVIATGSLLVLTWLLLYLVVVEDVETRGNEIALARLRGLGGRRVLASAVAEPLAVLLLAVPAGAALGYVAARLLARTLAGSVPVGLPATSWLAALAAVAGGAAAVGMAARRALARGVLDQWRTTQRTGPRRAWIFDAVLVTAAVAGLVDLAVTGNVTSSSAGVQVELVPSLLALAVATVLSRVLPPTCRWLARATRRRRGLAWFLALRHVGRRRVGRGR